MHWNNYFKADFIMSRLQFLLLLLVEVRNLCLPVFSGVKTFLLLLVFTFGEHAIVMSQSTYCQASRELERKMEQDAGVRSKRKAIERFTRDWIGSKREVAFREVVTIPVVVHVVWKNKADSISEAQVHSQIEALNRDFRLLNGNEEIIPEVYRSRKVDMEIEFCLANIAPDGTPTNGITYTKTDVDLVGATRRIFYTAQGGHDAWNTIDYLNVWVGQLEGTAGIASFPGQDIPEEDGIRISPKRFGTIGTVEAPYDQGKTLTHEIGHYFNLFHLWGGQACDQLDEICCANLEDNCPCDDEVMDTPALSSTFFQQCPTGNILECGNLAMYMNFMTFADDACMAFFTEGQKLRVWATLNGPRRGLLNSPGCGDSTVSTVQQSTKELVAIYPNPANSYCIIRNSTKASIILTLFSVQGQQMLSRETSEESITINTADLPSGIYWLKLRSRQNILTKKLIIER